MTVMFSRRNCHHHGGTASVDEVYRRPYKPNLSYEEQWIEYSKLYKKDFPTIRTVSGWGKDKRFWLTYIALWLRSLKDEPFPDIDAYRDPGWDAICPKGRLRV